MKKIEATDLHFFFFFKQQQQRCKKKTIQNSPQNKQKIFQAIRL